MESWFNTQHPRNLAWWHIPIILALGRWRQEDREFKGILFIWDPCLRKRKRNAFHQSHYIMGLIWQHCILPNKNCRLKREQEGHTAEGETSQLPRRWAWFLAFLDFCSQLHWTCSRFCFLDVCGVCPVTLPWPMFWLVFSEYPSHNSHSPSCVTVIKFLCLC